MGMVVGTFTSVSLNPPLVGFLPAKGSTTWPRIETARRFCVRHRHPACRGHGARAEPAGRPWSLIYGGRSRSSMAFVPLLLALPGGQVSLYPEDETGLPGLPAVVADADGTTAVYCCGGPEGLLRATEQACTARTPAVALHVERFPAAPGPARLPAPAGGGAGEAAAEVPGSFEVELARTGTVLTVAPDRSVLETVRDVMPEVPSSCEEGICGTCRTTVLEGVPDHRDDVLSPDERERGGTMMICVSRCATGRLLLDLWGPGGRTPSSRGPRSPGARVSGSATGCA